MATLGFTDNDGADLGNKFVTKEYVMDWYPDLVPNMLTPQLWSWGYNMTGGLGDSTIIGRSSPVTTAAGGANWKQVACGGAFTAAIKTDGTLWTWGYNQWGTLGNNTTVNTSSPVTTIAGGTNWQKISCGSNNYTLAIKTDGTLWTCGYNTKGALGDNTTVHKSSPVTTVAGGTNWKQVSGGNNHATAIKTDGTLWMWGDNSSGQLGDNTTVAKSSPVTTAGGKGGVSGTADWKQVAGGTGHTAAVKTDGTLWTWGLNDNGQLGDNTTLAKSSPVTTIAGGTNWKQVAGGAYHNAAVKTDGTLWTWGYNGFGGLGDNTTVNKSSPVTTITGGTNWKQVAAGNGITAAVKTDGTLWNWGYNIGSLGDNTVVAKSSPVTTIAGGTNWKQVACGASFTAAISESEGW